MSYDRRTKRLLICLILLTVGWAFIAVVGRARGETPYADRSLAVTVVLGLALLTALALSLAVPIVSVISIAKDSAAGKMIAAVVILIEAIVIYASIFYILPYGIGR